MKRATQLKGVIVSETSMVKLGTQVKVIYTGNGHYLLTHSNGNKRIPSAWTIWIRGTEIALQSPI